jgi:hypothetical protein
MDIHIALASLQHFMSHSYRNTSCSALAAVAQHNYLGYIVSNSKISYWLHPLLSDLQLTEKIPFGSVLASCALG